VCVANVYSCEGADLHKCDAAGQSSPIAQTCNSAAHCQANGTMGQCLLCDPGDYRCSGSLLQTCSADQLSFDLVEDCGDPTLCDKAGKTCLPPP
jgi:hypothetical protein